MKNTIKIERARKNWTQADLAEKIGISRQAVTSIESGKFVPSTLLALKMAEIFGSPVEQIFQLEEHEKYKQEPDLKMVTLSRSTFQLRKEEQILARLVYENMLYAAAEFSIHTSETYRIKPSDMLGFKLVVTKNEKEIARLHLKWQGKVVIHFTNGPEYTIKTESLLSDKFLLLNNQSETVLELISSFSWGNLSFTYDIRQHKEKEQLLLVVLAVFSANYYLATMAATM